MVKFFFASGVALWLAILWRVLTCRNYFILWMLVAVIWPQCPEFKKADVK